MSLSSRMPSSYPVMIQPPVTNKPHFHPVYLLEADHVSHQDWPIRHGWHKSSSEARWASCWACRPVNDCSSQEWQVWVQRWRLQLPESLSSSFFTLINDAAAIYTTPLTAPAPLPACAAWRQTHIFLHLFIPSYYLKTARQHLAGFVQRSAEIGACVRV